MLKKTETYHPRTQHSLSYYHLILLALIEGVTCRLSDSEIAALLSSKGLRSPSGKPWSATGVKAALFKLRHFRTHPSRLHGAALQLIFDGLLMPSALWTLFEARPRVM